MESHILSLRLWASSWYAHAALRWAMAAPEYLVAGPWYGEVGHEVLHWIPFLRWAKERFGLEKNRIVAISRGGVQSWYDDIAGEYFDVFDRLSLEEFRAIDQRRPLRRQMRRGEIDIRVLAEVAKLLKGKKFRVLHPSLMNRIFLPFWKQRGPAKIIARHTAFTRFPETQFDPSSRGFPAEYVAVKFYRSDCLRPTPLVQKYITGLIERLARQIPVVSLDTDFQVDDHANFSSPRGGNIYSVAGDLPVRNNLAIQAGIVSRAKAFVGTYGGFAYIAPMYGVPSIALYSEKDGFAQNHLHIAQRVFARPEFGAFIPLAIGDFDAARTVLRMI